MKSLIIGRPKNIFVQFFRYFWVGGSSAVVDLVVYSLLLSLLEMAYPIAAFFGYIVGLAWNYVISIFWVFDSKNIKKEIILVFFIAVGGLLWTWLLLYVFISVLGIDQIIAKMISQVLILGWNFGMRKLVVFK